MKIVVLGLTITSTWGNGHATTYRALLEALVRRGHHVTFLEREVPWYRDNRDASPAQGVDVRLYHGLDALRREYAGLVREAEAVVFGSYVPDGKEVAQWVLDVAQGTRIYYDIDTPVSLEALAAGTCEYMDPLLLEQFDVVFSFAVGNALTRLEALGARRALPLPCAVDAERYAPTHGVPIEYDLGYMGTYSDDRQPAVERLLAGPARHMPQRRFAVAGSQFPELEWPANIRMLGHMPFGRHVEFYASQRFTLNVTREAMVQNGHSPSVRLFEAAAVGTPVISDAWQGLDEFFHPGREIVVASDADDVAEALEMPDEERQAMGRRARQRVLDKHTAAHRAMAFEDALGATVEA